jgi:hypothetical protein
MKYPFTLRTSGTRILGGGLGEGVVSGVSGLVSGFSPPDGPPGVKTIWTGLQKLYTLLDYRELFNFMGQV